MLTPKIENVSRSKNLQVIFMATLINAMSVASIAPAFPRIVERFHLVPQSIGLLITVFTLPGLFLAPVIGVLGDRLGRKKILVPSLFLFGIAGGLCAFTRQYHLLLIFRFVQGIGAAAIGLLNITIIGDLFSGKERTAAMGYNASILSLGVAVYPLIGGAMALLEWFYPFYLAFLGIPVGVLVLIYLKNPEPKNNELLKNYLLEAWRNVRKCSVIRLFLMTFFTFIVLYGSYLTYFPLLLHDRFKASSFIIGLLMFVLSASAAVTSTRLGQLSQWLSSKSLLKIGFLFYALSMATLPFLFNLWAIILPAVIFGVGNALVLPTIQSLLADRAAMENRAAFMSINGMVLRLGQTLGPIVMGSVAALWGIRSVFFAGAVITVFVILFVIRKI
ncbi:bacillibactin exporter [bacterium BMS3Abin05]|nr:bacillibactin exporter [bacterium BMS3Abin05]